MGVNWFESLGPWTGSGEFDLGRMERICATLGDLQNDTPCFHVAGTNGKGSTSACIAAILGSKGLSVGLNSSPHLSHYSERFLIDGEPIGEGALEEATERVEMACNELSVTPSFHEGATLVAFEAFRCLDRAVYEVGLGGRLDASNVLKQPLVSVVTSIGLDHQAILGESIEIIAREKAGIFKDGTPAVVGAVCPEAQRVIREVANGKGVSLFEVARDFIVTREDNVYRYKSDVFDFAFECSLSGEVQLSNIACALKACELSGIDIKEHSKGLKKVHWPGRYESIEFQSKKFLLDCAHNQQGIENLIREIHSRELKEGVFIFGMLKRPDWQQIVSKLAELPFEFCLLTAPGERGLPARELKEELEQHGAQKLREFDSDYDGILEYAVSSGFSNVVVAGSIYMVGELRPLLVATETPVWIREKN